MSKTNFDYLRELCVDNVEALEFIDAIEESAKELNTELDDLKADVERKENELDDRVETQSVDLGLCELHYKLDPCNIRIKAQFETWINQVKKQNVAGVQLFHA